MQPEELEYVSFWPRVGAALIDAVLVLAITWPLLFIVYGKQYLFSDSLIQGPADFLISWVLPAVVVIWFWCARKATPGKMAIGAAVVDAKTGGAVSIGQAIIRYLGYFVSMIPLFLGLIWVALDPKNQGWHDKLAGTVVVRPKDRGPQKVKFG